MLPSAKDVVTQALPADDELAYKRAVVREVARRLENAYWGILRERYDWTIRNCEFILQIDPRYSVAQELKELAQRLRHANIADVRFIDRKIEPWILRTSYDDESVIPLSETFRFPSRDEWAELRNIADPDEPTRASIRRTLDETRIDLAFERTSIEDILAYLRDVSGLNILLDASTADRRWVEPPISVQLRNVTVREALRQVLAQANPFFDFRVTEEKVVLITTIPPGFPLGRAPVQIDPTGFEAVIAATRVELDVQNWPLSAIVDDLRTKTGLDLRLLGTHDEVISIKVRDLGLRPLLKLLLGPRNLDYTIDGVTIWIGRY